MTLDDFFTDSAEARTLFDAVAAEIARLGEATVRVTKSQVAFRRRRTVAIVWMPGQYLKGPSAPLVLTLSFRARDPSPRWKEIVEAAPGRFTHHLELRAVEEIDDELRGWLRAAWDAAS